MGKDRRPLGYGVNIAAELEPAEQDLFEALRSLRREIRETLALSAPVAATQLGMMAMGLVDIVMVGPLGTESLAAVSVGNSVFFALLILCLSAVPLAAGQVDLAGAQIEGVAAELGEAGDEAGGGEGVADAGHEFLLQELGMRPLLDLGMRLGEGTGAALAMALVESAIRVYNEMATFSSAGVAGKED